MAASAWCWPSPRSVRRPVRTRSASSDSSAEGEPARLLRLRTRPDRTPPHRKTSIRLLSPVIPAPEIKTHGEGAPDRLLDPRPLTGSLTDPDDLSRHIE